MWPILFLMLLSASAQPTPQPEAQVLWREGKLAFDETRYLEADQLLSKLIHLYPAATGALEAHHLIGLARIELKKPSDAIAPLKHYTQAAGNQLDGNRARLSLAKAYLELGQSTEAFMAAQTVVNISKRLKTFPAELLTDASLWKAQALLDLKKIKDADFLVTSIGKSSLTDDQTAHSIWLELQLKLYECQLFPGKGRLDEGQVRELFSRKGLCLNQAGVLFKNLISKNISVWSDLATPAIEKAFTHFHRGCQTPPQPPGKRTLDELKAYRAELRTKLVEDCQKRTKHAIELIEQEKEKLPETAIPYITRASHVMKTFMSNP